MRGRSRARQRCVEALFEAHLRQVDASEVIARNPEVNEYANTLIADIDANELVILSALEQVLARPLDRAPGVDRAILLMGAAELLFHPEIDPGTIINEAVEIASRMSTDDSGSYINGALGALAKNVRN